MENRKKGKVLIVEDEEELLLGYERALKKNNYHVQSTTSAEKAKEILKEFHPDIILSDVILPKMSGFELLSYLKSNKKTRDVFVVLMSSKIITPDNKSLGLESGADAYLAKPINLRELVAWIDAFMRHKITIDQLKLSEKRFRIIINKNADGIIIVNKDGIIKYANPTARKMFDKDGGEIVGSIFGYPIVKDSKAEIYIYSEKGFNKVAEMHVVEVDWEGEKALLASIRDITNRKIALEALKKSEAFNRGILDSLKDNIAVIDKEGRIIAINEAYQQFLVENGGDMKLFAEGDNYVEKYPEVVHAKNKEEILKGIDGIKKVMKGDFENFEYVYPFRGPSDEKFFFMRVTPMKSSIDDIVISHIDITKQKKTEEELRKHKENLEKLVMQRTSELEEKVQDLEHFNELFVGREFRIKELKDKLQDLQKKIEELEN